MVLQNRIISNIIVENAEIPITSFADCQVIANNPLSISELSLTWYHKLSSYG